MLNRTPFSGMLRVSDRRAHCDLALSQWRSGVYAWICRSTRRSMTYMWHIPGMARQEIQESRTLYKYHEKQSISY
jgi:hypothetical protein